MKSLSHCEPAGLFLNKSTTLVPQISPMNHTPAVDTHRSYADVLHLNQLHKADNCSNCGLFVAAKCKPHGYKWPYIVIECEQWEYRGKKI